MLSSGKMYLLQSGFTVSGPFHSLFVWFTLAQAGMLGRVVSNWVSIIDLGVVLQWSFQPLLRCAAILIEAMRVDI